MRSSRKRSPRTGLASFESPRCARIPSWRVCLTWSSTREWPRFARESRCPRTGGSNPSPSTRGSANFWVLTRDRLLDALRCAAADEVGGTELMSGILCDANGRMIRVQLITVL
jgi:hypothetical protein